MVCVSFWLDVGTMQGCRRVHAVNDTVMTWALHGSNSSMQQPSIFQNPDAALLIVVM